MNIGICRLSRAKVAAGGGSPSTAPAATSFFSRVLCFSFALTALRQRVFRLILIDRAAFREIARDELELRHVERRRAEQRVRGEILAQPRVRFALEPRQRHVRREAAAFRLDTAARN